MNHEGWSRRWVLRALAASAVSPVLKASEREWTAQNDYLERLETFFSETETRPALVWTNCEDVLYHDMEYPEPVASAPEYCPFLMKVWVFNRAMQWARAGGAILCYEDMGILPLSGDHQVSAWHTGRDNSITNDGEFTQWTKSSPRRRDCLVLPAFQFSLNQHPVLELEVSDADADWQFCATLKGRCGPPLLSTPWQSGPGKFRIDVAAELLRRGFDWAFPEMHFAIGTWHEDPGHKSSLRFRIRIMPAPAVTGCLPVIRTEGRVNAEGVPLLAVITDTDGRRVGSENAQLDASFNGVSVRMTHSDGLWTGRLRNVPAGEHIVQLASTGSVQSTGAIQVRITDGRFFTYDRNLGSVERDGKAPGPLTGSYQGTFYFRNAGTPNERMVQTQSEWNQWSGADPESERMHFWESLKREELDERLRLLSSQGWDLLTLHQHWGAWERLDAGGRIAPHGAEQLARYLQTASRYGLAHIQALSSGPYASPGPKIKYGGTIPYSRYLEEGFQTQQFAQPGSHFDALFHQYLDDFATLFSDETALFAMTASGEGDHFNGPARTNDVSNVIRRTDRNHLFFAETVLVLDKLPQKHSEGFKQDLFGGRTYFVGNQGPAEYDIGAYFKFLQMAGMYLAEGSWPPMPAYTKFHFEVLKDENGSPRNWTGTERYRLRLRDTLYLAFVHRLPAANSWDEMFSEDEHFLLRQIRNQVNWSQQFASAPVAVLVDDNSAKTGSDGWQNIAAYEKSFAHMGLMYRFVPADGARDSISAFTVDGRQPFQPLRFQSAGGSLPDSLKSRIPVQLDPGYAINHLWSSNGRTMLAYLYNTTNHERDYMWLCGTYHRSPRPANLRLQIQNLPQADLTAYVYDLNAKALLTAIPVRNGQAATDLGLTDHDYFLLVKPQEQTSSLYPSIPIPEKSKSEVLV